MKLRGTLCCYLLFAAAFTLHADDAPTVEIFTGWSWMPYRYGYPTYPYGWGPYVGLDDPYWEYGCGVRYPLKSRRLFPNLGGSGLPPLPGATPTELRSSERKTDWDRSIEAFLGASAAAPTNVPPSRAPVSP